MVIKASIPAPDFQLPDETGSLHKLSDYRGKYVILYFYPKDDTPGCTTEACGFRDDYTLYQAAGAVVLGVSPDAPKSHIKFKLKYNLPYTLLSDVDHAVCEQYGVWGLKISMGLSKRCLKTSNQMDTAAKYLQKSRNRKTTGSHKFFFRWHHVLQLLSRINNQP